MAKNDLTSEELEILESENLFTINTVDPQILQSILSKVSPDHPLYPHALTVEAEMYSRYKDVPPGEQATKFRDVGVAIEEANYPHFSCWKHYSRAADLYCQANMHADASQTFIKAAERQELERAEKDLRSPGSKKANIILCYQRAIVSAHLIGDEDLAVRSHIRLFDYKLANSSFSHKAGLWVIRVTSLYGESPWRIIGVAGLIIALCAIAFSMFGLDGNGIGHDNSYLERYLRSLYFSVVTFTTLGYGDFYPKNGIVRFIAASEALLGVFITSLFMVTVVKKFSRRT